MAEIPRLDILIYAHDGRGLGHVSRSIAVGMALRRLYPGLRVLLVTGCRLAQELIGPAPLDWLKLPAYATRVLAGKSRGIAGRSLYEDSELAALRARELTHLVELYRPRLVLVDHTPQGKHRELAPALSASRAFATIWVLGVRGVVGEVPQAQSTLAAELFAEHYRALLWYGDSAVLGGEPCRLLQRQYGTEPVECGYAVRLAELVRWQAPAPADGQLAGTIAVPWLGEESFRFLRDLAAALKMIPPSFGGWRLFIDGGAEPGGQQRIAELFRGVANCRLEPPGGNYAGALQNSRTALVYGGYNSIMDILHVRLPALVVYRQMADEEQRLHLERLIGVTGEHLTMAAEAQVNSAELARVMSAKLAMARAANYPINTDGAARAAGHLVGLL